MIYACDYCHKGVQYGGTHTHGRGVAGGRWKKKAPRTRRVFKPNLHAAAVMINGIKAKLRLCTKCLRKLKIAK